MEYALNFLLSTAPLFCLQYSSLSPEKGLIQRWLCAKGRLEDVARSAWQSLGMTKPVTPEANRRNPGSRVTEIFHNAS